MEFQYYVYVYLDPRKPGNYIYGTYTFEYEPFYIGKGCNNRAYSHLSIKKHHNSYFSNKIKKIRKECGCSPIIIKYKEMLLENTAYDIETDMIKSIGRYDLKLGPLCNMTNGGDGGMSGYICSNETKKKMSDKRMGTKATQETKEKDSKAKKGINNPMFGKILSEEHKQKLFNSRKKYSDCIIKKSLYLKDTGCTHKKISEILNIPLGTVRWWYRKQKLLEVI